MEKLIELLNEYEKEREMEIGTFELGKIPYREWSLDMGDLVFEPNYKDKKYEDCIGDTANSVLISKSFGFIEWLVENEKINFEGMSGHGKIISYLTEKKDYKWNDVKEGVVLMLLSIKDNPIEFLVSILK